MTLTSSTTADSGTAAGASRIWHLVTGEFPPQPGGVGDYTWEVARGLAAEGDEVHVWCPEWSEPQPDPGGNVRVHRSFGTFRPPDLRRVGEALDRFPAPRRIVVQWVPHSYRYRSMNVGLCAWLWRRAAFSHDKIDVMVHEPFLAFHEGSRKQDAAAAVHRVMVSLLLRAASRVWVSIPEWERRMKPFAFGRKLPWAVLPVPSNVPVVQDDAAVARIRAAHVQGGGLLVGHFGTYGDLIAPLLHQWIPAVLRKSERRSLLLMGGGGERFLDDLVLRYPDLDGRVFATGRLSARDLSLHLQAVDILVQPYPDGVSSRRGSVMAGLSHGLAILTTTGHLTEDFWSGSGCVGLTPAARPGDLPAEFERLVSTPGECARLRHAARQFYDARFDVRHTVGAMRADITFKRVPTKI